MKLHSLTLTNFKGQKNFTLTADGENVSIFGCNASGKTTLADAFSFLLFGKDSMNRTDFEILPVGPDGERVKGVTQAEVEAVVELDGRKRTIKRVYAEKWGQRGDQRGKLLGHTTDYSIDGVPLKEKEFKAAIEKICDEATFKLLTNPRYFCEVLKWQDRRTLLLRVCGDVTDADVIASDKALAELPVILKGRSLEDHRKVVQAAIQAINKTLAQVPVRIDEVNKGLPAEVAGTTEAGMLGAIAGLKDNREDRQVERARLVEGNGVAEKESELLRVETKMLDIKNRHLQSIDKQARTLQDNQAKIKNGIEISKGTLAAKIKQRDDDIRRKAAAETERALLLEEYHKVDADNTAGTCTYCGQALPQEKANAAKSKRLESILTKGKTEKSRIEQLDADMNKLDGEIEAITESIDDCTKDVVACQGKIDDLTSQSYAMSEDYLALAQEERVLTDEIAELNKGNINTTAIDNAITSLEEQIRESENTLAQIRQRAAGMKRIDELMAEQKKQAENLERNQKELYLTELFTKVKVSMLTDKINGKFKLARFKLFDQLVNGGIEECCEVTVDGVPYDAGLNNSMRINVGLDIINTLAEDFFGFEAPIMIDNAEAVNELTPTVGQQIRLYVSEDPALRVEKSKTLAAV